MCQRAISLYVALRTIVGDTYTERDEISVGQFISYCLCHLEFIGSSNESRLPESLTQVNARKIRTLVFPKLTIRSLYLGQAGGFIILAQTQKSTVICVKKNMILDPPQLDISSRVGDTGNLVTPIVLLKLTNWSLGHVKLHILANANV